GVDCKSGVCTGGLCRTATCGDNTKNQTESDVDCGSLCPKCGNAKSCAGAGDCQSNVCSGSPASCQTPSCTDLVKNGSETDDDCGGGCPKCSSGRVCGGAGDGQSGVCVASIGQR